MPPKPKPPQPQQTNQYTIGSGHMEVKDHAKERENHAQAVANTLEALKNHHRAYSVEILSHHGGEKDPKPPPDTITIKKRADGREELHVGQHAVHNWNWDKNNNALTFTKGDLGGHIEFPHEESVQGFGTIRNGLTSFSVRATLKPVTYELAFSSDAGAYVKQDHGPSLKLVWDASGDKWKNATWENNVLSFTYGIKEEFSIGQKTHKVIVNFKDLQTNVTYSPAEGDFFFTLLPSFQAVLQHANSAPDPPADPRDGKHVFPYLLEFTFNPDASSFEGAILTKALDGAKGEVYAVKGTVQNTVSGTFLMAAPNKESSMVEVSHGRLMVGNEAVPSSKQVGDKITWHSMPMHLAGATDLPPAGTLQFSANTSKVKLLGTDVKGSAFSASHPPSSVTMAKSTSPNPEDLLNLSQFKQDGKGNYYDCIQQESMQDFYTILQYYMDPDLREKYLGMNNPPSLGPTIKQIADTNGSPTPDQKANGDDGVASTWYKTLSVAYLTHALPSEFPDDPYAGKLNTIRASQWLKTQTAIASVYMKHSSDLYKNRWLQHIPLTSQFLLDQRQKSTEYAAHIDQDKSTWEKEIKNTVEDSENQTAMLTIIDKLTTLGKEGKYWAYWLFRDLTKPAALQMMQTLTLGAAAALDGSAFSRRIQQNCAVLGILDESGEFQHQYVKVIQIFQLTNVLPQLLDFSGDMSHYEYAVMEILKAFQEKYIDSKDPKMQEAANDIRKNASKELIKQQLTQLQKTASTTFNMSTMWAKADDLFRRSLGKMCACAAAFAGVAMLITGFQNWSKLGATEKAEVVTTGVLLFVEAAAAILKRGVALSQILTTEAMGWKNVAKILVSGACEEAITQASSKFAKFVLYRRGQVPVEIEVEAKEIMIAEEAEEDLMFMEEMLGSNLEAVVASGIGAAFAVLGIITSAINLSKSETKLAEAGDILNICACGLQLCTAVLGVAFEEIAALCACLEPLAVVAAIVGVILQIVSNNKPNPTPMEIFATDQASTAGLYMKHGADIDSFQSYQPAGELEKEGISLLMGGSTNQHLQFKLDGTLELSEATDGPDTVFYLITDAFGRAKFISKLPNADNTAIESKFLTIDDNGTLSGSSQLTKSKADQQLWVADCQGSVNRDKDKHLQSASFKFYSYYWYKNHSKKYYLGGSNNVPSALESNEEDWTVSMASTKPVGLSMKNITLYTFQMEQAFQPTLLNPGSDPKTWNITPALPDFMQLDTTTGKVSQKTGVKPAVTASATYTLGVKNSLGSSSTTFTFEVKKFD